MAFEAKMVNLSVPVLLNDALKELHESNLQCAKDVIQTLKAFLENNSAYYGHTVEQFQNFVSKVAVSGLQRGYSAFFCIPQADGTTVELFPGGSRVEVTSHNLESFLALYKHYCTAKPYRYTDYPTLLPLSARFSLASDYLPILALLENEIAKWKLDEVSWAMMDVCYCIPRNGVLVDIQESGRTTRVAHNQLANFVASARASYEAGRSSADDSRRKSSPAAGTVTPKPEDTQKHYENFESYIRAIYYSDKKGSKAQLTPEEYRSLDVSYYVPVLGKIVDLIPNGRNILVPFTEKDVFCRMAALKLGISLDAPVDTSTISLPSRSPQSKDGLMSPRNFEFDMFGPSKTKNPDGLANSLTKALTPEEVVFHFKMVLRQLAMGKWSDSDLKGLNLFYEVPVNGQLVPLVEDGYKIPVNLANKDDFVVRAMDALGAQMTPSAPPVALPMKGPEEDKVLGLFSPSHFEADLFAPYVPSAQVQVMQPQQGTEELSADEQNFWNMLEVLQNGFQPSNLSFMNLKFVLKFPNGRIVELKEGGHSVVVTETNLNEFIQAAKSKREAIHLAFRYSEDDLDPILQFPKEKAGTINSVHPKPDDISNPLFSLVEGLAGNEFSEEEFEQMKLIYCVPLASGDKYDLVPDGRNIPVTAKYRDDFVKRVLYERDQLQSKMNAAQASTHALDPMQHSDTGALLKSRSITSIPLTSKQIEELLEFRDKVLQLRDMDLEEAGWNDLRLAWCIRCDEISFNIIPDGSTKVVPFVQREEFIHKCVAKCDEIIADQYERKHVSVPQANAEEMGLFSPTHFEQDLFAPAQHITTKTNMAGSTNIVPAPPLNIRQVQQQQQQAPVSSAAAPPPVAAASPAAIETLKAFLERNSIGSLFGVLSQNCVEAVNDLLELKEEDLVTIIPAVLPRRRLTEAIAKLHTSR